MTRQFYKNPPRVFRSIIFLGAENLWGDFLFYWAADSQVFRLLDCALLSVGAQGTAFSFCREIVWLSQNIRPTLFNQTFGFAYTFGAAKREPNRPEKRGNLSRKRVSPFRLHRLPAHTQSNLLADSPAGSRLYQGFSRTLNPRAEFAVDRIARLAFLHGFLWSYSPSALVRPLYPLYNGLP